MFMKTWLSLPSYVFKKKQNWNNLITILNKLVYSKNRNKHKYIKMVMYIQLFKQFKLNSVHRNP